MHQYSAEAEGTGQSDGTVYVRHPVFDLGQGAAVKDDQEPDHGGKTENSCLDQQLRVVVVRFIDEEIGIERAELRVNGGESSESPSEDGLAAEHLYGVAIDGRAHAARDFGA